MTEPTSPSERYANVKVLEQAPQQAAPKPPSERYATAQIISAEDAARMNLSQATSEALDKSDESWLAWGGRQAYKAVEDFGRSNIFSPLARPISALILTHGYDLGLTYEEALERVKRVEEARDDPGIVGQVLGAVVGGGIVASGLKKGAAWASARSGVIDGMMKWGLRRGAVNRAVAVAATGAAAGAVEEGIRTSLEEAVDASGGEAFDGERITDNMMTGALVGLIAAPAMDGALTGLGKIGKRVSALFGGNEAQGYQAAQTILRQYANKNETLDQAADRLKMTIDSFTQQNGRPPALAEIMKPEQVAGVAEVARYHTGLDMQARELGEAGVRRALESYDAVVTGGAGKTLPSPEGIQNRMEQLFTDVMRRHGDRMVSVDDETLSLLSRNSDWLTRMAGNGNVGAEKMTRVLDAKKNIDSVRTRYRRALDAKNSADARAEVTGLREDLARLLDNQFHEGGVGASDTAALTNLIRLRDAIAKNADAARNASDTSFRLEEIRPQLDSLVRELDTYSKNGLQISLSDANQIRSTASRHYNTLRGQDPSAADEARRIRNLVAPIGKGEVPEYGEVVKRWNLDLNRTEAYDTGIGAVRGDLDMDTIVTRLVSGRLPNRPKASTLDQRKAIREGAGLGARFSLSKALKGTPREGLSAVRQLSESGNARGALRAVLGKKEAARITSAADQVVSTYNSMSKLVSPKSASALAEDRAAMSDALSAGVFGSLGGAGRAYLLTRMFMRFGLPRGTAEKTIQMLGDPKQVDQALKYMQNKGTDLNLLLTAVSTAMNDLARLENGE